MRPFGTSIQGHTTNIYYHCGEAHPYQYTFLHERLLPTMVKAKSVDSM